MTTYRIKPEFLTAWDATADDVVTAEDVERFAHDWEVPKDDIMMQLYENTPVNVAWYTGKIISRN